MIVAVGSDEIERAQARLLSVLERLEDLLTSVHEGWWASWVGKAATEVAAGNAYGLDRLLGAYGGMGSFNDLVLTPMNGHHLDPADVSATNRELTALREEAWQVATELRGDARRA